MDDLEKTIRDSKEEGTPKVNKQQAIYSKASSSKTKPKIGLKVILVNSFILILAIGFFVFGIIKVAKGNNNTNNSSLKNNLNTNVIDPLDISNDKANNSNELKKFESEEELKQYLKASKKVTSTLNYLEDETVPGDLERESTGNNSSTYQTNTRVEGVDEDDVVKVSGDYIFYVTTDYKENSTSYYTYKVLRIYKHSNNDLEFVKEFVFEGTSEVVEESDEYIVKKEIEYAIQSGLFVTDKYVVLPVSTYEKEVVYDKENNNRLSIYSHHYYSEYKIIDNKTCELVKSIRTRGYNKESRLIGNELYIVNSYYDFLLGNGNFDYPCIWLDDLVYYAGYDSIYYYPSEESVKTITSIYRVKLDDEITVESFNIFSTYSNLIYMTLNNLYIIDFLYNTDSETNYRIRYNQSRITVVNVDGKMNVEGTCIVDGNPENHYWIDENDKYLRVVSNVFTQEEWLFLEKYTVKRAYNTYHYVTIFEKNEDGYKEISKITEGIGKDGETIRSVRFNENILTVVTYRTVDPIYYIDLSDPLNPEISSEYEISGYSVYQLPYKDNYVIGLGYETSDNRNTGIKITLFDISDKENIHAYGLSYVIPYLKASAYTYVEALYNPKALLVNKEDNLFGFSVLSNWYNSSAAVPNYWDSSYYLFTIDLQADCPIVLVEHANKANQEKDYRYYYRLNNTYTRMVYVDNKYYLLSAADVVMYEYNNGEFTKIKTVSAK